MAVIKGFRRIQPKEIKTNPTRYQNASSRNDSHFEKSRSIYTGSGYGTGTSLTVVSVLLVFVSLTGTGTSAFSFCSLFLIEWPSVPSSFIQASDSARDVSRWLVLSGTTCFADSIGTGTSMVTVSILTVSIYSILTLSVLLTMTGVEGNICFDEWHPESMREASDTTIITRFFIGSCFEKMFIFWDSVKARTAFDILKRLNHSVAVEVGRCVAVSDDAFNGRVLGNQSLAE